MVDAKGSTLERMLRAALFQADGRIHTAMVLQQAFLY
jgi:hypothetical protein